MSDTLKTKKVLFYDSGLYTHIAEALAPAFAEAWYFADWRGQFPTSKLGYIGDGLDGLERVHNEWDYIDQADLIVFLDVYHGNLQRHLRQLGKRVWGNGEAESLETDRWQTKTYLRSRGMAINETYQVTGLHGPEGLIEHLAGADDRYVKGGKFRGDFETFHHDNLWLSKPWLGELSHNLGPTADLQKFLVEHPIKGVEVGFDGFSIDGQFPQVASFGYEVKDAAYIGKVYETPPKHIEVVTNALSPFLQTHGARGFLSIEYRVGPDRQPYIVDPCCRCGSPPSETYIELFSNWPEVIYDGAGGLLTELTPSFKFGVQLVLKSDWAKDNYLAIEVPSEVRRWVKLHNHFRTGGIDYIIPVGISEIGGVVGCGDTLPDAVEACREHAETLKAFELDYDPSALEECMENIVEGRKHGITW